MLAATPLTTAELTALEHHSRHAAHHRERRRALAILGHHRGQSLPQLAALFAVRYATGPQLAAPLAEARPGGASRGKPGRAAAQA